MSKHHPTFSAALGPIQASSPAVKHCLAVGVFSLLAAITLALSGCVAVRYTLPDQGGTVTVWPLRRGAADEELPLPTRPGWGGAQLAKTEGWAK